MFPALLAGPFLMGVFIFGASRTAVEFIVVFVTWLLACVFSLVC